MQIEKSSGCSSSSNRNQQQARLPFGCRKRFAAVQTNIETARSKLFPAGISSGSSTEVAASSPACRLERQRQRQQAAAGSISGTKRRIFWHAEANMFLAAAATAVTLILVVVIAADAKSCLLNSGNGNANSRTKGQSERGENGRGRVRGRGRGREGIFERGPVPQMCKSN